MNPISELKRLFLIAGFIESRHLPADSANALLKPLYQRVASLVAEHNIPQDKVNLIEQLEKGMYNDEYKYID